MLLEEGAGGLDGVRAGSACALGALALLGGVGCGTRKPGLRAPELLDRLGEARLSRLHDEADDVAMRAAAEAVIEALVLDDAEGRRLLVVKGTEADIFAPAPDELDPPADDFGERQALAQLVEEAGRKGHRLSALSVKP